MMPAYLKFPATMQMPRIIIYRIRVIRIVAVSSKSAQIIRIK